MKGAIVLCSGGLDSVVCAHYVKKKLGYDKSIILFFNYGQRTLKEERKCSKKCASYLGASFLEIKIKIPNVTGQLMTKEAASNLRRSDLKNTKAEALKWYVPQRNLIFLSYALSVAESLFIRSKINHDIFVGFKHEGQEHYPDTTPEFVSLINEIKASSKIGNFSVKAPFIKKDKEDIIKIGNELGVELEKTYSCYSGTEMQCGTCLACRLRQEGFYWANVRDKTKYEKEALRLAVN